MKTNIIIYANKKNNNNTEQVLHMARTLAEPRHRGKAAWPADLGRGDRGDEGEFGSFSSPFFLSLSLGTNLVL